jgi:hypothetical protein
MSDESNRTPEPTSSPEAPLPAWAQRMRQGTPSGAAPLDPETELRFSVFIGPRWKTYRAKLQPFFDDPSFVPTWNWAAAFFSPFWFLYRKLYLAFLLFWFAPSYGLSLLSGENKPTGPLTPDAMLRPENRPLLLLNLGIMLSASIAAGGTGNYFLWRRGRAALAAVELQQLPSDESITLLRRVGGVSPLMLALALAFTLVAARALMLGGG